jgi:hypothetical protein
MAITLDALIAPVRMKSTTFVPGQIHGAGQCDDVRAAGTEPA